LQCHCGQLLRQALIGPEGLVINRLAYKFAVTQEKAFLTGSGAGRPLGLFTASPNGISTARDVSTGNTTTEIRFDGLIEAKFTLKGQYWPRARWIFHRGAVKQITKLKDGDGQYIWRQSVREGEPGTLLGLPMTISEWAPNTFASGLHLSLHVDDLHPVRAIADRIAIGPAKFPGALVDLVDR
jgi:HK97 family phage major capsid protein